ncbi:MAG: hypothetical protein LBD21_01050 [Tannerellaceae bacterium]|nr:hypothetical protein [Tannerellaceae bacterium]
MIAQASSAQFLDYGVDPLRYKWNIARLPHYNLIYPRGLDSLAYRYALYLENAYGPLENTAGRVRTKGFPVVMHPGAMVPNGMVAWAPRRMELLTTPSARHHAEPWEQHLAIHESRHVLQMGKLATGFFRPFYFLVGEQMGGVAAAFVPRWYFEGDAVSAETALTGSGRGRLPEFQMIYRAQMLSGRFFSFDKWALGSYKNQVGTYYTLGYEMAAYARYRYGADVWSKTTSRYAARPISLRPMSDAFRKHTGIGFGSLFRQTFDFLRSEWERTDTGYITPAYLSRTHRHYTSMQYPQLLNDSTVVCIRTGMSDIAAIVTLSGGRERRLTYAAAVTGKLQTAADSSDSLRIYWLETTGGIRWTHESFARLKYMEPGSTVVRTFAPAYSRIVQFDASARSVALSLIDEAGAGRIALVDVETERETGSIALPSGTFVKELAWGDAGELYAATVGAEGIGIHRIDTACGEWTRLLEATRANISGFAWHKGRLLFESGLSGINNIYALNPEDKAVRRLTRSRFGAFQPTVHNNSLIFADYQSTGYRIASLPLDSAACDEADFARPYRFALAEAIANQEPEHISADRLSPVSFSPKPYRKASHLFKLHSWAPLYFNINDIIARNTDAFLTAVRPGLMLISQNSLNTAVSQAAWYYADGHHHGAFHFTYMGLMPVVSLKADMGGLSHDMIWKVNAGKESSLVARQASRTALNLEANAYLPLVSHKGGYIRGLRPSVSWVFANDRYQQYQSKRMPYMQYLRSEIWLYAYRRMAAQELLPRLGWQFRLQHLTMPFQPENIGDLYAVRLTGYLPGILRSHSLMLRAGWQYQDLDGKALYNFNRLLDAPRGHAAELRTQHQALAQADYAFPLVSPDLSIFSLAYIRRIRANIFGDISLNRAKEDVPWDKPRYSYGSDLLVDWNALRLPYALQTGVRLVYPVGVGQMRVQLISSISF